MHTWAHNLCGIMRERRKHKCPLDLKNKLSMLNRRAYRRAQSACERSASSQRKFNIIDPRSTTTKCLGRKFPWIRTYMRSGAHREPSRHRHMVTRGRTKADTTHTIQYVDIGCAENICACWMFSFHNKYTYIHIVYVCGISVIRWLRSVVVYTTVIEFVK